MALIQTNFSEELTKLNDKLTSLIDSPARTLKALVDSGKVETIAQDIIKRNLDDGGGGKWPKDKAATIKRKIKLGQPNKTLEARGDSRKAALAKGGVKVSLSAGGSSQIQITVEGDAGRIFGYHARGTGRLPERNVLDIHEDDGRRFGEAFNDALGDQLRARFGKR